MLAIKQSIKTGSQYLQSVNTPDACSSHDTDNIWTDVMHPFGKWQAYLGTLSYLEFGQ